MYFFSTREDSIYTYWRFSDALKNHSAFKSLHVLYSCCLFFVLKTFDMTYITFVFSDLVINVVKQLWKSWVCSNLIWNAKLTFKVKKTATLQTTVSLHSKAHCIKFFSFLKKIPKNLFFCIFFPVWRMC